MHYVFFKSFLKEVGAPIRDGRQAPSKRTARAQAEAQRGQRVEKQLLHLRREPATPCPAPGAP